MAKGKATGLWKGKVGNNVFYKITNSNNAQKQGIRERVIEVSNPKTTAQASQRYKLLPAQRIASALKEIVERGQQGVKYGALSRNQFLSRALKMTTGFPYMEKDDPNTIPGEYQLTKGTLPEIKCTYVSADAIFDSSLNSVGPAESDYSKVSIMSKSLLDGNPWLQEGDQVTVVMFEVLTNGVITSQYASMIIDSEDDSEINEGFANIATHGQMDCLSIQPVNGDVIAAAIIISRANGANGYLRSNATLAVNKTNEAIAKYFTPAGNDTALKTYEGDTSISNNTNWPVDIDGDGGASGAGEVTENVLYTLTAADKAADASSAIVGKQILVGKGANTGIIKKIYYVTRDEDQVCIDANGDPVSYNSGEDSFNLTVDKLSASFKSGKTLVDYEA